MSILPQLKQVLEEEELTTVGRAFGGTTTAKRKSFSVPRVRDWLLTADFVGASPLEVAFQRAREVLPPKLFKDVIENLVRFSFLIELTNLKVGSTKMKTRWLPAKILMPQADSFEPVQGDFKVGNDPRASAFDDCTEVFAIACNTVCDQFVGNPAIGSLLLELAARPRVPYEFPLSYSDLRARQLHLARNIAWVAFQRDEKPGVAVEFAQHGVGKLAVDFDVLLARDRVARLPVGRSRVAEQAAKEVREEVGQAPRVNARWLFFDNLKVVAIATSFCTMCWGTASQGVSCQWRRAGRL